MRKTLTQFLLLLFLMTALPANSQADELWRLSAEDRKKIAELQEYRRSGFQGQFERFHKVEYAKAWVYMADTLTNPKEIADALRQAGALHSNNPANKLPPYSEKLIEVVDRSLQSKDPRVVDVALDSATWIVAKPNPRKETADLVMDVAESYPDPAVRRKAFDSLWVCPLRSKRFENLTLDFLKDGNDPDTLWVGIRVVSVQYKENTPFPKELHDKIVKRTWQLMDHKDPKVSEIAVTAQENLFHRAGGDELERVGKRLVEKLKDDRPAIRSRAAQALAELDYEPALHSLVRLLGDDTENSYGEGGLKRYTSRQHRVDDAVLTAIHDLTRDMQYLRFTYSIRDKVNYDPALQSEVSKEALRAMNWYQQNKANLPGAPGKS